LLLKNSQYEGIWDPALQNFSPSGVSTSPIYYIVSPDSSVDISNGYRLNVRGSIPARIRYFSAFHSVQTGSGAHTASYPMRTGASYPEVKRLEHEAGHSPPSSA
jgi:hypothetical protein